jgi:hypothetical protein
LCLPLTNGQRIPNCATKGEQQNGVEILEELTIWHKIACEKNGKIGEIIFIGTGIKNDWRQKVEEKCGGRQREQRGINAQQIQYSAQH